MSESDGYLCRGRACRWLMSAARWLCAAAVLAPLLHGTAAAAPFTKEEQEASAWSARFAREVDFRLDVPPSDQQRYMQLLQTALTNANVSAASEEAFVLVDRSAHVQAAFVILRTEQGGWHWMGATAVSTGKTGTFEHFLTPLGVFAHTLDNPDYRAEGTFNKNHIRGYGLRGMRIFDFGWQVAERGWGSGGTSKMRLQMHATDPSVLEPRLGRVASEGCIRIPATLNTFLDSYGILDADYERALADDQVLWLLPQNRQTIARPGRYMVIVDSQSPGRPAWARPLTTAKSTAIRR